MELSLATWKTKEGIFFTGIVRDITERKQAEKALKKSREQLRAYSEGLEKTIQERTKELNQLIESQKEFIAHISHELRNPLSVIKAVAEAGPIQDKMGMVEQLTLVNRKVDHITRILKNLSLVSRLDIGQTKIRKTKFKFRYLLEEVLKDIIKEANAEHINPEVSLNCPKRSQFYGDRIKMAEVLTNLLRNAVVHARGRPRLSIKVKRQGDWLQVIVEDNNLPISKKDLGKIFERLYRGRQAEKKPGSGLGLYISKRLVDLMEGKIWAESKKDGNRFVVELPIT